MQFIPRCVLVLPPSPAFAHVSAAIFIVITILYAKLFVFLRRPDKIRSPYSNTPTGSTERTSRMGSIPFRPVGVVSNWFKKPPPKDFERDQVLERRISYVPDNSAPPGGDNGVITTDFADQSHARSQQKRQRSSSTEYPDGDIPPWERVELPVFQVDGQRYGGASTNLNQSASSAGLWSNWKGLGGSTREHRKRTSTTTASSSSPVQANTRNFGSGSSMDVLNFTTNKHSPTPISSPRLGSVPSMQEPLTFDDMTRGLGLSAFAARGSASTSGSQAPSDRYRQFSLGSEAPSTGSGLSPVNELRRSSEATQESRASTTGQPTLRGMTPVHFQPSPPDSDVERNGSIGELEQSGTNAGTTAGDRGPKNETYEAEVEGDRRAEEEEEDENWDLMRMLQQSAPPRSAQDRFAPETVEFVEESMASYLNR